MAEQSLQEMQMALTRLKSELEGLKSTLLNKIEEYRNIVDRLNVQGLSREVHDTYLSSYYEKDRSLINALIDHIEEYDVPYVDKNLQATGVNKSVAESGWDF